MFSRVDRAQGAVVATVVAVVIEQAPDDAQVVVGQADSGTFVAVAFLPALQTLLVGFGAGAFDLPQDGVRAFAEETADVGGAASVHAAKVGFVAAAVLFRNDTELALCKRLGSSFLAARVVAVMGPGRCRGWS